MNNWKFKIIKEAFGLFPQISLDLKLADKAPLWNNLPVNRSHIADNKVFKDILDNIKKEALFEKNQLDFEEDLEKIQAQVEEKVFNILTEILTGENGLDNYDLNNLNDELYLFKEFKLPIFEKELEIWKIYNNKSLTMTPEITIKVKNLIKEVNLLNENFLKDYPNFQGLIDIYEKLEIKIHENRESIEKELKGVFYNYL